MVQEGGTAGNGLEHVHVLTIPGEIGPLVPYTYGSMDEMFGAIKAKYKARDSLESYCIDAIEGRLDEMITRGEYLYAQEERGYDRSAELAHTSGMIRGYKFRIAELRQEIYDDGDELAYTSGMVAGYQFRIAELRYESTNR